MDANPNECEELEAEFSTGAGEEEEWTKCGWRDDARLGATIEMVPVKDVCARRSTG